MYFISENLQSQSGQPCIMKFGWVEAAEFNVLVQYFYPMS